MIARLAWVLAFVLAACAIVQAVLAAAAIETNADWAGTVGSFTILVAAVVCAIRPVGRPAGAIGVAAAGFLLAGGYTLDPYYFPSKTRYIAEAGGWIFLVYAVVLAAGLLAFRFGWGRALVAVLLPVALVSSAVSGLH